MASSDAGNKKTIEEDLRDINADLEDVKEPVPEALDLLDRDPTEMNEFVKVSVGQYSIYTSYLVIG